jgi:hypothetical protein
VSPPPNWPASGRARLMHRFTLRRDRGRASGPRAWEPCGLIGHPVPLDNISDAASPGDPVAAPPPSRALTGTGHVPEPARFESAGTRAPMSF